MARDACASLSFVNMRSEADGRVGLTAFCVPDSVERKIGGNETHIKPNNMFLSCPHFAGNFFLCEVKTSSII